MTAAIGSLRKKLTVFNDEGDDDYGSAGMYFNPSMFPPHRPEKEVKTDSAHSSSNKCKNYLLKIYSQHINFLNTI